MKKASLFLAGILMVLICLQTSGGNQQGQISTPRLPLAASPASPRVDGDFGKIPLQFIPNQGQMDGQVAYYVQGRDKTIYFASEGLTFVLAEQAQKDGKKQPGPVDSNGSDAAQRWVVKLDFVDSNADAKPVGLEKSGAVISYFKGKPEEWKAGLPAYSKIAYQDLWPGIDLLYYGTFNQMKYEFIIHPGADPSRIKLAYRGAEKIALTEEGRLEVETPMGGFEDDNPFAYQDVDGERMGVSVKYVLGDVTESIRQAIVSGPSATPVAEVESLARAYCFEVGEYDRSRTLVLDPAVLVYCGYIGGSLMDNGYGIALDGSGNAYIVGSTVNTESTFPVTVGPDLTYNGGGESAFIAKVNASGTALVYCGYIGGSGGEIGIGIAVDGSGNAYVTGQTSSTESTFPVTIGPDLTYNAGNDAFVAKVNASGTSLDYCGYIGGSGQDDGYGIAVDGSGNAYVTGWTTSTESNFPLAIGPDLTQNGYTDIFVARVNSAGTALDYCGYIGGAGQDYSRGIAVDSSGDAYVTGRTASTESTFPVTVGPDLTYNLGDYHAFVAKVNDSGTSLDYCGYIGGSGKDDGYGIAVDGLGNAYVTGSTTSTESTFPVTVGPDLTYNGSIYGDAFIAKVNNSGTALVYCGYIGGASFDGGYGVAVDSTGNAFITGITTSTESTFPVAIGPDLTYNDNGNASDAFVAKVNASGTAIIYCGYIGGSDHEHVHGIAVDSSGNAYIVGNTESTGATFPVIAGPDLTHNGNIDAFVAKVGNGVRVDFNRDGQEDILWRCYNSGGWNRVWFLGGSGLAPQPLALVDSQMKAGPAGGKFVRSRTSNRTIRDPRDMGMILNRKKESTLRDSRELMGGTNRHDTHLTVVDDPRAAGRAYSKNDILTSPLSVSDPRYAKYVLNTQALSANLPEVAAAQSLLGGADVLPVSDLNWQVRGTADFNGDGNVDILWRYNGPGGYNIVWFMNGTNWIGSAELLPVADLNWQIVGTGDFNNDGNIDILWRYNAPNGSNVVWFMNGTNWTGSTELLAVSDPNWQIVGTADFNKDGNVDILWRYNGSGGYNYIWYMSGINWIGGGNLLSVVDLNWQIAGTGDYNSDGNIDILWRYNGSGGYNVIWHLNGATWIGSDDLLPVADLTWRIVSR